MAYYVEKMPVIELAAGHVEMVSGVTLYSIGDRVYQNDFIVIR